MWQLEHIQPFITAGDDQGTGVEDPRLNLHLDLAGMGNNFPSSHQYVALDTPPRVLTLEDRPFPSVNPAAGDQGQQPLPKYQGYEQEEGEETLEVQLQKQQQMNGYVQQTPHRQISRWVDLKFYHSLGPSF